MNTTSTPNLTTPLLRLLPPLRPVSDSDLAPVARPHLVRSLVEARTALEALEHGARYDDNLSEYAAKLERIAAQIRGARPVLQLADNAPAIVQVVEVGR